MARKSIILSFFPYLCNVAFIILSITETNCNTQIWSSILDDINWN